MFNHASSHFPPHIVQVHDDGRVPRGIIFEQPVLQTKVSTLSLHGVQCISFGLLQRLVFVADDHSLIVRVFLMNDDLKLMQSWMRLVRTSQERREFGDRLHGESYCPLKSIHANPDDLVSLFG